jgi:hypothetical protein
MHDLWPYITGAYAATGVGLAALALNTFLRLRYWARRAREEDKL